MTGVQTCALPISSPASSSVLTAQSLEPASDSASPFLAAPPLFKQKTAYEIMSGDWSSDVCSSDLDSVLTAQSLEPASDSVSPSLSDPPPIHALSLSVSKINKR